MTNMWLIARPNALVRVALALFLASVGAAPSMAAQDAKALGLTPTGQPKDFTLTGEAAHVTGFRGATWGMTMDEVRATLIRDFEGATATPPINVPSNGTTVMVAPMAILTPGPGPAAITYVFGRNSGRLVHVNLDWRAQDADVATRDAMIAAGAKAVAGFVGMQWKPGSVLRGVVVKPSLIVLFGGADDQGGGVDVRLGGVPYMLQNKDGTRTVEPPPAAPATLHIGFSAPDAAAETDNVSPSPKAGHRKP